MIIIITSSKGKDKDNPFNKGRSLLQMGKDTGWTDIKYKGKDI